MLYNKEILGKLLYKTTLEVDGYALELFKQMIYIKLKLILILDIMVNLPMFVQIIHNIILMEELIKFHISPKTLILMELLSLSYILIQNLL